jgi:hypothetical protein
VDYEKNNLEKLMTHTVNQEVELLKNNLGKKYKKILEEMNKRGILYSGITRKNVKDKGNEIVKEHLKNLVETLNNFPVQIEEKYWLKIGKELKKEIEDSEGKYSDALAKITNPGLSDSNILFQDAKGQLEFLVEDNILKNQIKGFEDTASYGIASNKHSIIALIKSIISIVSIVLT